MPPLLNNGIFKSILLDVCRSLESTLVNINSIIFCSGKEMSLPSKFNLMSTLYYHLKVKFLTINLSCSWWSIQRFAQNSMSPRGQTTLDFCKTFHWSRLVTWSILETTLDFCKTFNWSRLVTWMILAQYRLYDFFSLMHHAYEYVDARNC